MPLSVLSLLFILMLMTRLSVVPVPRAYRFASASLLDVKPFFIKFAFTLTSRA